MILDYKPTLYGFMGLDFAFQTQLKPITKTGKFEKVFLLKTILNNCNLSLIAYDMKKSLINIVFDNSLY